MVTTQRSHKLSGGSLALVAHPRIHFNRALLPYIASSLYLFQRQTFSDFNRPVISPAIPEMGLVPSELILLGFPDPLLRILASTQE